MAKQDKKKEKKQNKEQNKTKLKDLTQKQLEQRRKNRREDFQEALDSGDTEKAKQINDRLKKINNQIDKKSIPKPQSYQEKLDAITNSDGFKMLSPANQQVVLSAIDLYTPEKIKNLNLSKNELKIIRVEAEKRAMEDYNYSKEQFELDAEQSLRNDTATLQRAFDEASGGTAKTDADKLAIRNLQDALKESQDQYQIAADRKNLYLQNALGDIQNKLDTETFRANESETIQLRQLQRNYTSQLRDVQNTMASRGLAMSGIRLQGEETTTQNYNDTVTTAQLTAQQTIQDAQTLAEQQKRDVNLMTSQDLQDLVTKYTDIQRDAIQGTEGTLGTEATRSQIESGGYTGIGGSDIYSNIIGGITGQNTTMGYESRNAALADYERLYGTQALLDKYGSQLGTYKPAGDIIGTKNTDAERAEKERLEQEKVSKKAIIQQEKENILSSRIM